MLLKALLVFLATAVTDAVWTFYITSVNEHEKVKAGLYSTALVCIYGYIAIEYTKIHWLLIPAGIGAFVGTYFSIRKPKTDDHSQDPSTK